MIEVFVRLEHVQTFEAKSTVVKLAHDIYHEKPLPNYDPSCFDFLYIYNGLKHIIMLAKYQQTTRQYGADNNRNIRSETQIHHSTQLSNLTKPSKETLNVFGKLLYALAKVDGAVQPSEIEVLREIVGKNKWAKQIEFSFNTAKTLDMDPHTIFVKNMRIFHTKPCQEHYSYFLELMEKIAEAHEGIVPEEKEMIDQFKKMWKSSASKNRTSVADMR